MKTITAVLALLGIGYLYVQAGASSLFGFHAGDYLVTLDERDPEDKDECPARIVARMTCGADGDEFIVCDWPGHKPVSAVWRHIPPFRRAVYFGATVDGVRLPDGKGILSPNFGVPCRYTWSGSPISR